AADEPGERVTGSRGWGPHAPPWYARPAGGKRRGAEGATQAERPAGRRAARAARFGPPAGRRQRVGLERAAAPAAVVDRVHGRSAFDVRRGHRVRPRRLAGLTSPSLAGPR